VKLGTISPEGKASVYCYRCNDDVADEQLAAHLKTFGINVKQQIKTEKTISELVLIHNLNFNLSKLVENGRTLTPVFGPGLTGLQNIGNSCYINAVLQSLFALPEFQEAYFTRGLTHQAQCQAPRPADCFLCQMAKLAAGLCSGEYSVKRTSAIDGGDGMEIASQAGLKINDFKRLVAQQDVDFSSSQMQDAYEYFQFFLKFLQVRQARLTN